MAATNPSAKISPARRSSSAGAPKLTRIVARGRARDEAPGGGPRARRAARRRGPPCRRRPTSPARTGATPGRRGSATSSLTRVMPSLARAEQRQRRHAEQRQQQQQPGATLASSASVDQRAARPAPTSPRRHDWWTQRQPARCSRRSPSVEVLGPLEVLDAGDAGRQRRHLTLASTSEVRSRTPLRRAKPSRRGQWRPIEATRHHSASASTRHRVRSVAAASTIPSAPAAKTADCVSRPSSRAARPPRPAGVARNAMPGISQSARIGSGSPRPSLGHSVGVTLPRSPRSAPPGARNIAA